MRHPLWPDEVGGDRLDVSGGGDRDGSTIRCLVVPSTDDPRLVVPTRPYRAGTRVLRALRDRSSAKARAQTTALSAAMLGNARTVELPTPTLFDEVAEQLQLGRDELVIGVHLGPPRANRKPVLAVADRRGELLAFVKVGVDDLTDSLVAREAEALAELGASTDDGRLPTTRAPRLLASGEHDGHRYVIQTPVPTGSFSALRSGEATVTAAQVEVARLRIDGASHGPAVASVRDRWHDRTAAASDEVVRSFADIASRWCDELGDHELEWGSWHGDWRVTNMSVTGGKCSVWDWERFTSGVPLGYDALHLFLTRLLPSVRDLTALPHDLFENAPRLLRPFGVTQRHAADLTATGYLLDVAGRYLDDRQAAAGARLGDVGSWLLPHLQSAPFARASTGGNH